MNPLQKVTDLLTSAGIATVGIIGVDQAPKITEGIQQISNSGASAAGSPDWIEPLLQGLIAVITILAQFFRNRPQKKKEQ